ncbi:hypothetical protein H6G54_29915 [Anabaena cylindrica FACHB-243]|uniref:Uncharacterized protein n=1 Tax=Anabaena cylindrica (strain ATCC 27899 / PCC 7122) TaxID=272123 RepID=K9ZR66_ANACC|nr:MULTISPECIES: hypothetical protein [Anabaena]AFZ61052.1 hypothetical protein Anacy_5751 [Anabaena cylindrica PCC 7122]MBD2421817.1 hypothetical protein [Anabaena cylindrica FACHB-243]MBY5283054.1 hypothetical protein [Anabaena sp. CCAP 1446/1C]MBY5310574.1 hypothetical protein [Anabaena sp. CCAP 1446/1C]MCM2408074.1 hypothetical protein [Anabaena sp. CCAP 1446/1C]
MAIYRQLTIWDILDEMSEAPATSSLVTVWKCLDAELHDLPVGAQLSNAALAFTQIADILKVRAESLLQDVRDQNHPDGPVISNDIFAGLVRTTMQLDLDDLIETPVQQTFQPHGRHQFSYTGESGDSMVAPVEKAQVLAMLEEVTSLEDVYNLASDEDVQKWQSAIAHYLAQIKGEISLTKLQRMLQMPMVEVWLGLLLGEFVLEQRGDFYHSQNIWIINH